MKKIKINKYIDISLKEYEEYVNTQRAIPDYRDGLKPVQRRILWSMYANKLYNKYAKCAKTVGDTIGNYHPHGDVAVYETMVNIIHNKYPLIKGRGNFGGRIDPPAAYRYTESTLDPLHKEIFDYIDIADMLPTFDGSNKEPVILPAKLPFLLINGTSGIGYGKGKKVNIPPHKMSDILKILIGVLENKSNRTLYNYITGPDYNKYTGKIISSKNKIKNLYKKGKGYIDYSCTYRFDKIKNNDVFIVENIPPNFSYTSFLNKCKKLKDDKYLTFISNNSSNDKIEILLGYKNKDIINANILPLLTTRMHYNFIGINEKNEVFSFNLLEYIEKWLDYRRSIEKDYIKYKLKCEIAKLKKEKNTVNIYKNSDKVIDIIKKNSNKNIKIKLKKLKIDYKEISNLNIASLSKTNMKKTLKNIKTLKTNINNYKKDLKNIDQKLISYFNNILTKYKKEKRNTVLRLSEKNEIKKLIKKSGKNYYYHVVIDDKGKFKYREYNNSNLNQTNTWKYDLKVNKKICVIYKNNIIKIYDIKKLDTIQPGYINIISDLDKYILFITDKNKYVVFNNNLNKNSYSIFKNNLIIEKAIGLKDDDFVFYAKLDKHKHKKQEYTIKNSKIVKRTGTIPTNLIPNLSADKHKIEVFTDE